MKVEKISRRRLYGGLALAAAALLLAVDQLLKYYVLLYLKPLGAVTVLDSLLEFSYVENTGAAFGLFKNVVWFVIAVTIAAFLVITILLFRYRGHTVFSYIASVLLIAGGLGNLLDRILYGFVVDFIHVMFFDYVFNFADCCVTVGAALFVLHVLVVSYREKKAQEPSAQPPEEQK